MLPVNKARKNKKKKIKKQKNLKLSPVNKVGKHQRIGDVGEKAACEV